MALLKKSYLPVKRTYLPVKRTFEISGMKSFTTEPGIAYTRFITYISFYNCQQENISIIAKTLEAYTVQVKVTNDLLR